MSKKAVVLANGAFPTNSNALDQLNNAVFIVCCDGAVNKLENTSFVPGAIVGDLDSLKQELKLKYHDRLFHFSDQDTNDLTKAVKWCAKNNFTELSIVGATGLRDDHMIGNIFLLSQYSQMLKVKMYTDHGSFTVVQNKMSYQSYKGQQVSVFATNPQMLISTSNLKYKLQKQNLPMLWQGTLNESLGEVFGLEVSGGDLIVYQEY